MLRLSVLAGAVGTTFGKVYFQEKFNDDCKYNK